MKPASPLILFVPGLRPKPPPAVHREELLRCLVEGVRRVDSEVAAEIRVTNGSFDIVGWTFDFYARHRDIDLDRRAIEQVLRQQGPSAADISEARALRRRVVRGLYRIADRLPFLIPQLADETMQLHLRDLRRYMTNDADIADATRRLLKVPLRAAGKLQRPVLLIGHSMGSVIAWETLWQLSHEPAGEADRELRVDLVTIGSPLGMRYIRRFLIGCEEEGKRRYPHNVRFWDNFAAVGELTAIDMTVRNDFADMISLGLTENIRDTAVHNYYRQSGVLNVHSEYGYLVNKATATRVRDWWRAASLGAASSGTTTSTRLSPGSA